MPFRSIQTDGKEASPPHSHCGMDDAPKDPDDDDASMPPNPLSSIGTTTEDWPSSSHLSEANDAASPPLHSRSTLALMDANRVDRDICRTAWNVVVARSAQGDEEEEEEDIHLITTATTTTSHAPAHSDGDRDSLPDAAETASASLASHNSSIWKPRGLTLSAYHRPEHSIRLTNSDPARRLESEYDLHGAGSSGVLGHGAYSTVRLARRRADGCRVAVKTIAKHEALRSRRLRRVGGASGQKYYLEEWEILRRLQDHPYVVTLIDVFETTEEIQLVTEFCPGGELFDAIQSSPRNCGRPPGGSNRGEQQAARITSQILAALSSLHALGIVHRDVKPENILLARPLHPDDAVHVKLCDFGVARPLLPTEPDEESGAATGVLSDGEASPLTPGSRSRSFSTVGTDYYAAPELTYGNSYDTAVDIYSLGVTLYILLCGFPPVFGNAAATTSYFTQDDDDDDASDPGCNFFHEEVLFPDAYWHDISLPAKSLLRRMLHPEPARRIRAAEAQQDPWIQTWVPSSATPRLVCATPPPQNPIDLHRVRHELYKSLLGGSPPPQRGGSPPKRRHSSAAAAGPPLPKRVRGFGSPFVRGARAERRSSATALMALADLYRGVTSPSVMARSVASATPADRGENPPNAPDGNDRMDGSSFVAAKSPVVALSF